MNHTYSLEDFEGKVDSLYRLVILAARRAAQVAKPESRALVPVKSRKTTLIALEEVLQGKVGFRTDEDVEENLFE